MDKYVVSKKLAKELSENGLVKDSVWKWVYGMTNGVCGGKLIDGDTPAPIAEELLELMPRFIKNKTIRLSIESYSDGYYVEYKDKERPLARKVQAKLSDALAEMILYLHKEGHLTLAN